ncbi:MAG TPA: hypothetical protein VJ866_19870 [Pyrinomonadaceae bacterium]|nr:hypothetical protein [Pyrinomonadaceae bacterium]
MNDQPNAFSEENWSVKRCAYAKEPETRGFLQLCADRRFHPCIQERFQDDAGLESPDLYWIHADAGGTPKMECSRTAPDYCYHKKNVRKMGWSAHGNVCGGFGDDVPDSEIRRALSVTAQRKVEEYPLATHFIYFATAVQEGGTWYAVVHCLVCPARTS